MVTDPSNRRGPTLADPAQSPVGADVHATRADEDSLFQLEAGVGPIRIDSSGPPFNPILDTFIRDLSFTFRVNKEGTHGEGWAVITPEMRSTERLAMVSVLSTIADIIGGVPAMHATTPRLALTLDLSMRLVTDSFDSELTMTSDLVKRGSRMVTTEVRFTNAKAGGLAALSYLSFMSSPRPEDSSPPVPYAVEIDGTLTAPFAEFVGLRLVSPGVVELDRRPYVVQPAGHLQGGIVALLGESAVQSLTGSAVTDLDVRFLAGVRVGPGRATAKLLGNGVVRAEVRDVGEGNRLTALVTAKVASH